MLLSAINLLSLGGNALIDCMTAAALPSTLVKCLYLFFDLAPVSQPDEKLPGCEFTPMERRILLQKVFVQVRPNFYIQDWMFLHSRLNVQLYLYWFFFLGTNNFPKSFRRNYRNIIFELFYFLFHINFPLSRVKTVKLYYIS